MSNFKSEKFLNIEWLKNATKEGGAQDEVIKLKSDINNIVLNRVYKKYAKTAEIRMWASCEPLQLLEMIKSNYGLYEVIHQYPHKVYFDIDEQIPAGGVATPLETHIEQINKLFPNSDYAVSGSITESKASYHIILNNRRWWSTWWSSRSSWWTR
jgi:hypothetical protein